MKRLVILALMGVAGLAAAQANPGSLYYGGDFNGTNGASDQHGGQVADSRIYDDFTLTSSDIITGVYSNCLSAMSPQAVSMYYEIRQGITTGNGGTLIASGTVAAVATATGRTGFGFTEYDYAGAITPLTLAAGTYFFCAAPDDTGGSGQAFISTTSGVNGVGGPLNDGVSYWDSTTFGVSFVPAGQALGGGTPNFSQGVVGHAVPEPASMAILGLGVLALLKRRRK